jgi:hypothetical protein
VREKEREKERQSSEGEEKKKKGRHVANLNEFENAASMKGACECQSLRSCRCKIIQRQRAVHVAHGLAIKEI